MSRKRRPPSFPMTPKLREFLSHIGKLGGSKGGRKAASNMTAEQRSERARTAARAKWAKAGKRKKK